MGKSCVGRKRVEYKELVVKDVGFGILKWIDKLKIGHLAELHKTDLKIDDPKKNIFRVDKHPFSIVFFWAIKLVSVCDVIISHKYDNLHV